MGCPYQAIIIQKTSATKFDIEIDWSQPYRELGNDTIASSTWAFTGLNGVLVFTDGSIGTPATNTTIWIEGGTVNNYYIVTNTIITQAGRTLTESFILYIVPYVYLTQTRAI